MARQYPQHATPLGNAAARLRQALTLIPQVSARPSPSIPGAPNPALARPPVLPPPAKPQPAPPADVRVSFALKTPVCRVSNQLQAMGFQAQVTSVEWNRVTALVGKADWEGLVKAVL